MHAWVDDGRVDSSRISWDHLQNKLFYPNSYHGAGFWGVIGHARTDAFRLQGSERSPGLSLRRERGMEAEGLGGVEEVDSLRGHGRVSIQGVTWWGHTGTSLCLLQMPLSLPHGPPFCSLSPASSTLPQGLCTCCVPAWNPHLAGSLRPLRSEGFLHQLVQICTPPNTLPSSLVSPLLCFDITDII